jgi:nitrite reductase/ring-hydroxylating ferredoxin subunit
MSLCDGIVDGEVIECPKHYGRFDIRSGRALGAPVFIDLDTFPVRVEDGTVYLEVA